MVRATAFRFSVVFLLVAFTGCTIVTSQGKKRDASIADLQQSIDQLEQKQSDLEERFDGVAEKSAEAHLAAEQMRQEVALMRGRFEEQGFHAQKYEKEVKGLHDFMGAQLSTVDERLTTLEKKAGIKSKSLDKLPTHGTVGTVTAPSMADKDPDRAYKKAYNAFKQNNLEQAKAQFREFIRTHPKSEWADDAQFHLAECYFKQGDFENAILEFDKVTAKYPQSKLVRKAFLNVGLSFLELGSKSDAKLFFEKVVADFPGTQEAKIAKKKLELLKK